MQDFDTLYRQGFGCTLIRQLSDESIIEIEEMGMFQGLLSFKVELAASESMFLFE